MLTLPAPLLSALSGLLADRVGLHFPEQRWGDLQRGIAAAAPAFGLDDAESCAHRLLAAPLTEPELETLASHLTVGETYFFRDRRSFEILAERILPELLRARENGERRLRIWSAGCCTGEEAYSIAMVLDRCVPRPEQWNLTVLATDINPAFLRVAAQGVYREWSFRDAPAWVRDRYFHRRKDGRWEILPRIRRRVTLSHLNLASDAYPSLATNTNAMDLIFCRNVLMYFTAERAGRVIENLHRCLVEGGWLVLGSTDIPHRLLPRFASVEFPDAMLYRKPADADARSAAIPAQREPAPAPDPPTPTIAEETATPVPASGTGRPDPPAAATVPERRPSPARMARVCADRGRLAEAAGWCERAIAADLLNPEHRYLLANIERERGRDGEAIRSLQRALYLQPDFALAHFALANLRLAQGRRREAERHLDAALEGLRERQRDDILPEADGLTAGRLEEIIEKVRSGLPHNGTSAPEQAQA